MQMFAGVGNESCCKWRLWFLYTYCDHRTLLIKTGNNLKQLFQTWSMRMPGDTWETDRGFARCLSIMGNSI